MSQLTATPANGLATIPDELTVSVTSWHDGTRRKYRCTLTHATRNKSWTSNDHDTLDAAIAEALGSYDIPAVDHDFWRGVRSVLPYAVIAWVLVIALALAFWRLLA
ncbi:MAG TPA: hypothetical protein VND94_01405 [Terriglobia bacterium]|nr:hypothetical protein [Terriglobia bacterium]